MMYVIYYIHSCICIHLFAFSCMKLSLYELPVTNSCLHARVHINAYMHIHVYQGLLLILCIYGQWQCMYVCMHACMYVCMFMYIHVSMHDRSGRAPLHGLSPRYIQLQIHICLYLRMRSDAPTHEAHLFLFVSSLWGMFSCKLDTIFSAMAASGSISMYW